jgi:hypothetical protein
MERRTEALGDTYPETTTEREHIRLVDSLDAGQGAVEVGSVVVVDLLF